MKRLISLEKVEMSRLLVSAILRCRRFKLGQSVPGKKRTEVGKSMLFCLLNKVTYAPNKLTGKEDSIQI